MLMKKILLGGIAVGAMAAAGSASALTLSGTLVGGKAVVVGTTLTPYAVASEAKGPFVTAASTTGAAGRSTVAGAATTTIVATLSTGPLTSGQYLVTYNLGGATFVTGSITGSSLDYTGTVTTTSAVIQTLTASQVVFLVTIQGGDSISAFNFEAPFTLAAPGIVQTQAQVSLAANPNLPLDNGATAATNIVNTLSGFATTAGTFTGAASSQQASIASSFKQFVVVAQAAPNGGATATVATIGSFTLAPATPATSAGGFVYANLKGTPTAAGDITGATYALTGTVGSTESVQVGAATSAAGSTTIPVATAAPAANTTVTLTQTNATTAAAALASSGYSLSVTPTLGAAYNSGSATTVALGSVTYQGTTILAPWVGDGSNNYQAIVRFGNSGAAIPGLTAILLNPLTASSGSAGTGIAGTCSFGAIPANSSITVSSAQLQACFGNFGNSDVLFSAQAAQTNISAKLRIINASTGVVTEQSLGSGQGTTFGVTNPANTTIF